MKAMIFSDLVVMSRTMAQMAGMCLVVSGVVSVATGSLVTAAACIAAMVPIMFIFTLSVYDEMNRWQSFRLTMSISRTHTVLGRYASIFIIVVASALFSLVAALLFGAIASIISPATGFAADIALGEESLGAVAAGTVAASSIGLLVAAVTCPLITRCGLTRATRIIPVATVLLAVAPLALITEDGPLASFVPQFLMQVLNDDAFLPVFAIGTLVTVLVLFAASAALSVRLYRTREL